MFNGTKNILIAPLSCKLGPNYYQTILDKWIDVYSTNDGKLRKINVHKIFFDNNELESQRHSGRFNLNSFQDFQMQHWLLFCQFPIPSFCLLVHSLWMGSELFNHSFSTVKYLPVLVRMKCYLKYTPTSKQFICKV